MQATYKHDCESCTFIGTIFLELVSGAKQPTDIYRSCQEYGSRFILRFSSEGPDYATTNSIDEQLI